MEDIGLGRSEFCALLPSESGAGYGRAINGMMEMLHSGDKVQITVIEGGLAQINTYQTAYPEAGVTFCCLRVLMGMYRIHRWMRKSVIASTKGDFDKFKAAINKRFHRHLRTSNVRHCLVRMCGHTTVIGGCSILAT